MKKILLMLSAVVLFGCNNSMEKSNSIEAIETAHKKEDFLKQKGIQFDIKLIFGGKERLTGRMTLLTNSSKGLIELKDSSMIYFDNQKVYSSPALKNKKGIRFDAYTWSYFFLFPYKLSDPGTIWANTEEKQLNGETYNAHKLTFESNVGDAPDDWYLVYADPNSGIINYSAYIVTANKSVEKAEEDPHAIEYLNYSEIDGIPLAHEWKFWGWRAQEGLTKELGSGVISNIQFINDTELLKTVPKHLIEV